VKGGTAIFGRFSRGSDALFHEIATARRLETDADPEERVEGGPHVPPPVPSEHEFVGISLQMALPEAVECAFRPPLEVRKDAVDPVQDRVVQDRVVQDLVRLPAGDDLRLVRVCRGIFVTGPAVRDDVSAGLFGPADETVQRF